MSPNSCTKNRSAPYLEVRGSQALCKQLFTALLFRFPSMSTNKCQCRFSKAECSTDWHFPLHYSCLDLFSLWRILFYTRIVAWHPTWGWNTPPCSLCLGWLSSIRFGWCSCLSVCPIWRGNANKPSGRSAAEATNMPPLWLLPTFAFAALPAWTSCCGILVFFFSQVAHLVSMIKL